MGLDAKADVAALAALDAAKADLSALALKADVTALAALDAAKADLAAFNAFTARVKEGNISYTDMVNLIAKVVSARTPDALDTAIVNMRTAGFTDNVKLMG